MFHNLIHPYVYEGVKGHLNIVNWKFLPLNSTNEQYRSLGFLIDQREKVIKSRLESPFEASLSKQIMVTIIPGWDCNLRCTHCVVIDKLKKPGQSKNLVNIPDLIGFIEDYMDLTAKSIVTLAFVGGEPLLYSDFINEVISYPKRHNFRYNATTNLAQPLTEIQLKVLRLMDTFTVSVDGSEIQHNKQRIPLYKTSNLYQDLTNNLKTLAINGLNEKVTVQSALSVENLENRDELKKFCETMLRLGISEDKLLLQGQHNTPRKPTYDSNNKLTDNNSKSPKTISCCRHRSNNIVINHNGEICSDYYSMHKLGTIQDSTSHIYKQYLKDIDNMPVLNDTKCEKCDVLTLCWGGCTNNFDEYYSPSDNCNQSILQSKNKDSLANQNYDRKIKGSIQ